MNDKPWINSYPPGVRWDAEIVPRPVQSILDDAVAKWPDRPAINFMGKRITYRDFGDLANHAAKGLQQLGGKPGVPVGVSLPNTPHYAIAFFGVLKAGGTVVNYSPLDAAKVLEHKVEDSRTDFLITLDMASLYPQMASMLGKSALPDYSRMTATTQIIRSPTRPRRLQRSNTRGAPLASQRGRCSRT